MELLSPLEFTIWAFGDYNHMVSHSVFSVSSYILMLRLVVLTKMVTVLVKLLALNLHVLKSSILNVKL